MFISRALPITIGLSFVVLTGVADATSTTCVTTVVCAEYINSSSGVAIHGEANTGIGIRGTSNGATGFYGATRSGSTLSPGVEGESLNNSNSMGVAGAFGLTGPVMGASPTYGVVAYGNLDGMLGTTTNPGSSTPGGQFGVGVFGDDASGAAGSSNIGVLGQSINDSGVYGVANAEPGLIGIPTGVIGDGEPLGKSEPSAMT